MRKVGNIVELERKGRVVIPKELRQELNLKPGQKLLIFRRGDEILIKPAITAERFASLLKGCVKKSRIDPMKAKEIWRF